jgi:hypothetical protein
VGAGIVCYVNIYNEKQIHFLFGLHSPFLHEALSDMVVGRRQLVQQIARRCNPVNPALTRGYISLPSVPRPARSSKGLE